MLKTGKFESVVG